MSEFRMSIVTGLLDDASKGVTTLGALLEAAHAARRTYMTEHCSQGLAGPLMSCLVRTAQARAITTATTALLGASPRDVAQARTRLAALVHAEQGAVARALTPLVVAASHATGFAHVRQLPHPTGVLIIGDDTRGRALQTELVVAPSHPLRLRSETIGFRDGSCSRVLEGFTHALHERGLVIAQGTRTSTLRRHPIRARVRQ